MKAINDKIKMSRATDLYNRVINYIETLFLTLENLSDGRKKAYKQKPIGFGREPI